MVKAVPNQILEGLKRNQVRRQRELRADVNFFVPRSLMPQTNLNVIPPGTVKRRVLNWQRRINELRDAIVAAKGSASKVTKLQTELRTEIAAAKIEGNTGKESLLLNLLAELAQVNVEHTEPQSIQIRTLEPTSTRKNPSEPRMQPTRAYRNVYRALVMAIALVVILIVALLIVRRPRVQ